MRGAPSLGGPARKQQPANSPRRLPHERDSHEAQDRTAGRRRRAHGNRADRRRLRQLCERFTVFPRALRAYDHGKRPEWRCRGGRRRHPELAAGEPPAHGKRGHHPRGWRSATSRTAWALGEPLDVVPGEYFRPDGTLHGRPEIACRRPRTAQANELWAAVTTSHQSHLRSFAAPNPPDRP
jgi:hypothetical protein